MGDQRRRVGQPDALGWMTVYGAPSEQDAVGLLGRVPETWEGAVRQAREDDPTRSPWVVAVRRARLSVQAEPRPVTGSSIEGR